MVPAMTLAVETSYVERAWTGVETSFAAGFTAAAVADVVVRYKTAAGVVSTLTNGVHASVTLDGSGNVTVLPLSMPAAPGTVILSRSTPAAVDADFANLADYDPSVHQALHDAAARRDQELAHSLAEKIGLDANLEKFSAAGRALVDILAGTAPTGAVTYEQMQAAIAALASGAAGPAGNNLFTSLTETIKTVDYAVQVADRGGYLVANKATAIAFGLPAIATLASYVYFFTNINDGPLTLDPNGAEIIWNAEGPTATTLILDKGDSAIVVGNGTLWRAMVMRAPGRLADESAIASAATCDIGALNTERVQITGAVGIASFGTRARKKRIVRFISTPTLTHSANLSLLCAADRTVVAGAIGVYVSDDAGAWREIAYANNNGTLEGSALAFVSEPTTKLFRNGAGDLRLNILAAEIVKFFGDGTAANNLVSITGGLNISKDVGLNGAISHGGYNAPAIIVADQNDYALPANVSIVSLTTDAARSITGFLAPTTRRRVVVWNGNALGTFSITFPEQNAGSAAANRFNTGGDGNVVIAPQRGAEFIYDLAGARWKAMRVVDLATTAQIWAATAGKIVTAEKLSAAQALQPLAFGATVTPDLNAGTNFECGITNAITANFALGAPLNAKAGQDIFIRFKQGVVARLITFNAVYCFPGGVKPTLTAVAGRFDDLFGKVTDTVGPVITCSLAKDVR
jgi:hypothetical protein